MFCAGEPPFDLTVVIVTYNSAAVIEGCLASLRAGAGRLSVEVLLVDNASTDDTIEVLACHPSTILTRNTTNAGFAEACNKGIRTARGRHLLLLNPDAVVAPNALEQLVAALERYPEVGLIGPSLTNPTDGAFRASLGRVPSLGSLFSRWTPASTFLASGGRVGGDLPLIRLRVMAT